MLVSVAGYVASDFILYVIISYFVLLMWGISWFMRVVLEEEDGARRRRSPIFYAVGFSFLSMTLIYFFPVRIGMVMFFTGIFSSLMFRDLSFVLRILVGDFDIRRVVKSWFKGS